MILFSLTKNEWMLEWFLIVRLCFERVSTTVSSGPSELNYYFCQRLRLLYSLFYKMEMHLFKSLLFDDRLWFSGLLRSRLSCVFKYDFLEVKPLFRFPPKKIIIGTSVPLSCPVCSISRINIPLFNRIHVHISHINIWHIKKRTTVFDFPFTISSCLVHF